MLRETSYKSIHNDSSRKMDRLVSCVKKTLSKRMILQDTSNKTIHNDYSHKTVRFAKKSEVKPTISRADMTEDEKNDAWILEHEALCIRKKCSQIINRVENYGSVLKNGRKICTRGLEKHIKLRNSDTRPKRMEALEIVLSEQKQQYKNGYCDEESLALVYSKISSECQSEAERIALSDQEAVESYLRDISHSLLRVET